MPDAMCRSCGAVIVWIEVNGKLHPCELKVRNVITANGAVIRGRESHFAHCPQAKQWRQKQGDPPQQADFTPDEPRT